MFYDSEDLLIKESNVVFKNCNDALDQLNMATDTQSPFTTISDVKTINSYKCVRKSLYGAIKDVLEGWGGHLVRDNFHIAIRANIGADNGITIRYAKNLNVGDTVKNVSFSLKKGEILGFSGLMGAGRTEVARALFGADKKNSGEIKINGKLVNIETPEQAVSQGICYISEDRKRFGLLLDKSVTENSVLASVPKFTKFGFIDDISARKEAEKVNKKLRTKTSSMSQILRNLSGGNQQKVVVARWLIKDADIFIFDEPTRGIDIGAKSEMYELMEELVKKGKSIIMISSELAEIQRCSDRVIVMCEGRKTAELPIEEATQENIMKYAMMRNKEGIA